MSCCGQGNKPKPTFSRLEVVNQHNNNTTTGKQVIKLSEDNNPVNNLTKAFVTKDSLKDKLSWFVDGVTGLKKCLTNDIDYDKEVIKVNREVCRNCEHSTKTDGKITTLSQCMAPDPAKNNTPCGCFILCKTQAGKCPLNKWTNLSINKT